MTVAAIPSPSSAVWELGPIPIRAYALCIVLGIAVACVVTEFRLRRRGGPPWAVLDIAVWAVPFGIVGARLYHVITSPEDYFGAGGSPADAFKIWEGGLGIWGGVAGGVLGAWIACRQLGIPLTTVADAAAPGLPLAQAVGRVGNWFNNELYGGVTTLPWGLKIHQMDPENPGHALRDQDGNPILEPDLYHPTFLYEALWNIGVAAMVLLVDRRVKLGKGRAFALYAMGYTAGRFWIEMMRTDEANTILGARVNVWVSALVFLGALIYFLRTRGPQEFLVPKDAPVLAAVGSGGGDVSQRDVSGSDAERAEAKPSGYRVVTEEQFERYKQTGELPPDDGPGRGEAGDLLDDFADDEPAERTGDVAITEDAGGDDDSSREKKADARSDAEAAADGDNDPAGDADSDPPDRAVRSSDDR
ncbi:prolipoprotein diacylglyceryl transferase [Phytohabitans flavus]|uniref:prolipoprotein diacylglyceryl transferase n=1 Tax=Phytohabitans flavus TaxID=1076124 RepID=UPI001E3C820A|nr:prolipoprotein diacylglyceryl transferase [Phytohabitans flavus]